MIFQVTGQVTALQRQKSCGIQTPFMMLFSCLNTASPPRCIAIWTIPVSSPRLLISTNCRPPPAFLEMAFLFDKAADQATFCGFTPLLIKLTCLSAPESAM